MIRWLRGVLAAVLYAIGATRAAERIDPVMDRVGSREDQPLGK